MKYFIVQVLDVYMIVIIARVVLSWIRINPANPFTDILYKLTEPVLAPVRSLLPAVPGIDISPVVVYILYSFVVRNVLIGM